MKTCDMFQGFMALLAVGFLSGKADGSFAEKAAGNLGGCRCVADTGSPGPPFLFLAIASPLSSASLWVGSD